MALTLLTTEEFAQRSAMPRAFVQALDQAEPGWVGRQLEMKTAWIVAKLSKRYGPFQAPYSDILLDWLTVLVTRKCWLRRGHDPTDEQAQEYGKDADRAEAEITEAANAETGLFDLPLRSDSTESAISRGGSLAYSEQSPFVSLDQQREVATGEDSSGRGTYV